jgi:peptide/nickel transport system substrate-binding protein
VFVKNTTYKPRAEPPSGLAGGKIAKVDRIEWLWIADAQTQVAALQNGELDMIESPSLDLLPLIAKDKNLKLFDYNPLGSQFSLRFNTLHKPFDNPKIRYAASVAIGQEDFLKASIGDQKYYKVCKPMFVCGTPLATEEGLKDILNQNAAKARELLKEAGYDGTPIVLMQSTDLGLLTNMAPVAKAQLEAAGFKVDMQSMDWQTLVGRRTKKDPARQGGLERLHHRLGGGRHPQSGDGRLLQRVLRQGDVRLAVRRDDREAARPVRQGDRSGQAKQIVIDLQNTGPSIRPTSISASTTSRSRCARMSGRAAHPVTVFWNITKKSNGKPAPACARKQLGKRRHRASDSARSTVSRRRHNPSCRRPRPPGRRCRRAAALRRRACSTRHSARRPAGSAARSGPHRGDAVRPATSAARP